MRIYYSFYLALLIPTDCSAIKYFTFDNVDSSEHSFASLVSAPNESLPESFTLCSSHVQNNLDGRGFFYLSDQNNRPWLTFRWVLKFGKLIFRIYIGNDPPSMLQIDNAEHFLLNSWNHVCVALDNNSGQISVSVNGNFAVVKMSPKDIPVCNSLKNRLHVGISGKSGHLEQFSGSVSNIQIYHGGSDTLGNIFEKACVQQGDYFAWEDMVWKKNWTTNKRKGNWTEKPLFQQCLFWCSNCRRAASKGFSKNMPEIGSWFNDICEQQNRVDEILKLVQKSCSTGYLSLYLDTFFWCYQRRTLCQCRYKCKGNVPSLGIFDTKKHRKWQNRSRNWRYPWGTTLCLCRRRLLGLLCLHHKDKLFGKNLWSMSFIIRR